MGLIKKKNAPARLTRPLLEVPPPLPVPTLDIVGFRVSPFGFMENAALIARAAARGQGMWILTLNLQMVAQSQKNTAYQTLARSADLVVADGMPIVWLSRLGLTPRKIPERTCGIDLVEYLTAAFDGPMGVLGGANPRQALRRLGVPSGKIVYVEDGAVRLDRLDPIIEAVRRSGCKLLFVALGVPKQDVVCYRLREACPGLVCIGVGGSFEVLGGVIKRAPVWAREVGLEWLYRWLAEPGRLWRRYFLAYPRALPEIWAWIAARRQALREGTESSSDFALPPPPPQRTDRARRSTNITSPGASTSPRPPIR